MKVLTPLITAFRPSYRFRLIFTLTVVALVVFPFSAHAIDLPGVSVTFHDGKKREFCRFEAETAITPEQQARGLMFRTSMRRRTGMLFINDRDDMHYFWMKNTCIPLDMIFINGRYEVVHVHKGARPHDDTQISSRYPARYILEVNAGEAKECFIAPGIKVRFDRVAADN